MPPYNYCAVEGCKSQKSNRSLSFFSLPVDDKRRKRWLEVIGRPDLDNPKTKIKCHFVCSLHFEKYMITSKPILKSDAEPVKFLPNQPHLYNIDSGGHKEASTQTTECYINGLSVIDEHIHTFPEVPVVKQEDTRQETKFQINIENIEVTMARIKQECIDNESEEEGVSQVETHTNSTQASDPKKKTKEPRKTRKRKPEKESKESEPKKKL